MINGDVMGNRLRQLRKEHGLTLEKMAKMINSNRGSLSRYELGEVELKQEFAKQLADFFDVSVDYLLGYSDAKHSDVDDFVYILYNETRDLTTEQKQNILIIIRKIKEIMKR